LKNFIKNRTGISSYLKVLTGAVLISFSSVYVKIADVSPTTSGFYRVFFGGIFLLLVVLLKKEKLWKDFRCLIYSITAGAIFAVDLYCWHTSIHYIGPGLATVIGNFQVFFLAIAGVFLFKEKISLTQAAAAPIAFFGLILVVGFDWSLLSQNYKAGLLLGLATALSYAVYILLLRQIQQNENSLSASSNLTSVSFFAAFFLLIILFFEKNSLVIPDKKSLAALLALGILSQGVGWIFITSGLPGIRAYLAGMLLLIQPALSFLWDIILFQRETTFQGYIGLTITLSAIYIGTYAGSRTDK